ncbi:MAG: hypothetical protein AAF215_04805 [Cyanobacteria bacterium P01_A01_bin.123]
MQVAIAGASLVGLSNLKSWIDAGCTPTVLERLNVLGSNTCREFATPEESNYEATPSQPAYCLSLKSPDANFCLTGDYAMPRYLANMEVTVLSGKLTAQAIAYRPVCFPVAEGSIFKLEPPGV